jgi:N-methylhydantoinase A/oxoprolinase/acetone carboxylase beta subunit
MRITMSHRIGRVGLLERENAALLNASLLAFADRVVNAFDDAMARFGINCPIFISQNDGTLMDSAFVREFPALTFSSGPTNSLRGAARLTGLEDAIVVDIGGTTSDIGVLRGGFPRESNMVVEVGGVRTNFRMPDVMAIGLGGGSIVADNGHSIGPLSVGHRLVSEGLVFGGSTLTATDIVVAAGLAEVGDKTLVAHLSPELVANGLSTIRRILENGIRKMKPSADLLPVILVGGGAILAPGNLAHASAIHLPENSGVANAIGAAIALIGGEAERFVDYKDQPRDVCIAETRMAAHAVAIAAGAAAGTIRVTELEETPIPYMDQGATRIRVKVVGDVEALVAHKEPAL